jgi:hypothetical protein
MAKEKLVRLKGFNPDKVEGLVVKPTRDMEVYVVPDRGLEVLDVLIGGQPVMYRSPAGHRSRASYDGFGRGPLAHIEAGFTAGLENVGQSTASSPLHGTFSVTPAADCRRTRSGGVRGSVNCCKLVVGPRITVERTVEPVKGKRAFKIIDELHASLTSDYMWLYHPNFPVVTGTRFVSSERLVVARPADPVSAQGAANYRVFERVGEGYARFPREEKSPEVIREENFEACFIMGLEPDAAGLARAALVAPDGASAAYVKYALRDFAPVQQAFQFWKNPRDGVSGLEVGSTFLGWDYARKHGFLGTLRQGEVHRYELEIGFLRTAAEVKAFIAEMPVVARPETKLLDLDGVAALYGAKVS